MEHLSLDAAEREDRHVDERDDQHAEEHRTANLPAGREHGGVTFLAREQAAEFALLCAEPAHDVFDDNHRPRR